MIKTLSFKTHEIAEYISWSYFFHAWGFPAKFAAVAEIHDCSACVSAWINSFPTQEDRERAAEAVKLYRDAKKMLCDDDGKYDFRGRFGLFDANSNNDDIYLYGDNGEITVLPFLRQQYNPSSDGNCYCLSDFIMPVNSGTRDRIGVFIASNDKRMEALYPDDDYKHMLCQTLSDRLAEAGTELMHLAVRRKYWGYAKDEMLSVSDIINAKYQGIRPAVGYPPMPDQSIIFLLDKLIDFSKIGVDITEIGAMIPHSSTCGLMFSHVKSRYFSVGRIGMDQLRDYSRRRGLPMEKMCEFLRANIVL